MHKRTRTRPFLSSAAKRHLIHHFSNVLIRRRRGGDRFPLFLLLQKKNDWVHEKKDQRVRFQEKIRNCFSPKNLIVGTRDR